MKPSHVAEHGVYPIDVVDAEGCFLIDAKGKKYIDFLGGWCVSTVGWKNPKLLSAQAVHPKRGMYVPPVFRFEEWERFATQLCSLAPGKGKLTRAYRCTSGSEAVEFAMKLARAATGRSTIVSLKRVYHGHTYGAASVGTGLSDAIAPGVPDILKLPLPDEYRNPFNLIGSELSDAIVQEFTKLAQTGEVAAFLTEPIFTNAGAVIPPPDFFPKIAKVCKEHGVLLVMDEVASGFGRTGKLFASEHWGIEPDILCLGKGISGGYATIAATLTTESIYKSGAMIPSYSTFGWSPNDLILAQTNIDVLLAEKLVENSEKVGAYLLRELKSLEFLPHVGLVRGIGMLFGVEIVEDKTTKRPDGRRADSIVRECFKQGLTIDTAHPGTLFFTPPLILDLATAEKGVTILKKIVEAQAA